ncbi:exopolysaccharide biosynthesis polyprenyl glycosylphosphotransferase [Sediminihabitans luteus]|uniref:Exopolysaccharide biosynthesis polyprenyl glycosylphosphotransferase n=1 Tax=Sediminihabitans luteus TaxID=1138585 RepID=A0A2M9CE21_9CELL|nr:sugar transferase [Sediminihabitans luteus]PJJ70174.1 exopolysaccharide biosynthesis polyprenyl glycosylphosphotransferase [Sediminihabitans luteus]GII97645.1 exopolysaccharide biosynthesis polyprenyl glycosylphosphotransferase [Sediminihabitans luteus]
MSGLVSDLVSDVRRGLGARTGRSPLSEARAVVEEAGAVVEDVATGLLGARTVAWTTTLRRRLTLTDTLAVLGSVVVAVLLTTTGVLHLGGSTTPVVQVGVGAGVAAAWLLGLAVCRTRDRRLMGEGPREYQRVFEATWWLFAAVAVFSYVFGIAEPRGIVLVALPLGLVWLLVGRYAWRQWLHRRRAEGVCTRTVLAVGHAEQVARLVGEFNGNDRSGYVVVGACVPGAVEGQRVRGVPVLGDVAAAGAIALREGAECVAVSGSDAVTADAVRRLGWDLERSSIDLMLTTELTDVAGPRLTITPAQGVSLVHVDAPRFSGPKYAVKTALDVVGALVALLLLLPVLLAVTVVVACSGRGGVIFRQERVGRNGETFSMLKFRTMRSGAEFEVADLADLSEGAGPLFKMREDPRVTRVGRFLRRYSIDELPQLVNVLRGEMSLVGPRPPLPSEVTAYGVAAQRRLLVKPGLTGLWQVGGRSDLSWDESVRLDVYYVENWTPFVDLLLIAKTARAIVVGEGAY